MNKLTKKQVEVNKEYTLPKYKCKRCSKESSIICIGGICGECLEQFRQWIFMRDLEEWLKNE